MKSNKKIKSESASIENVKRFFSTTPNDDVVSIAEAFRAWGRQNPENMEANKAWLSNVLYHLKYHNLIAPVYAFSSGRRKLDELRLTLKGKRALGRLEDTNKNENGTIPSTNGSSNPYSFNDVMKIIAKLRKENPDYEITFDVKLKSE